MRKRFDFVSDPSHGWLKVPMTELERLGIVDQISTYSYLKNGMAYLEEDRDMKVFLDARTAAGEGDIRIIEHSRNRRSRIRKYPMFGGDRMKVVKNLVTGLEAEIREDTPMSCDPSSELYHTM